MIKSSCCVPPHHASQRLQNTLSSQTNHRNNVPNSHWFANHGHEYRSSDQLPSTALQRFTREVRVLSTRPHSSIALRRLITQHLRGHPGNPKICPRTGCKQYRLTQTYKVPGTDLCYVNETQLRQYTLLSRCIALHSARTPRLHASQPRQRAPSNHALTQTRRRPNMANSTTSTQPNPRFIRSN